MVNKAIESYDKETIEIEKALKIVEYSAYKSPINFMWAE
jgi:hypothetical protein